MSGAGYTGHHINSVELGSLGQKWKGDPRNIVFLPNSNHPGGVDEIYILIKGIEVAGPIWGAVG